MKEMKFKKGCAYKASETIWRANPDFIRSMEKALFTKSSVYPCHVDGTLYSYSTFRNELIPDDYYDSFELVGYCEVKKDYEQIEKEAMEIAYSSCCGSDDFETFYKKYRESFRDINMKNKKVDVKHYTNLDGLVCNFD